MVSVMILLMMMYFSMEDRRIVTHFTEWPSQIV